MAHRSLSADLVANAPVLLTMYRGWWCPTNKTQLNEIMENFERLRERGGSIYAASVDEPASAQALQAYVGNKITILCNTSEALLKKIGVFDRRGAPWYDQIILRAPEQPIAMLAALVINTDGKITYTARSAESMTGRAWAIFWPA